MKITLTSQEKEFIERAKEAKICSFGIGSVITNSLPSLEIPGVMVINYKDRERPAKVWALVMTAKSWERGDF